MIKPSISYLDLSDSIVIDGTDFAIKRPIFIRTTTNAEHILATIDGQSIDILFRRRELKGWKKFIYKYLNKLGIYSCPSNKIAVEQLRYCGVIL